ncbi:MAG: hypothetical protein H6607_11100 [Flavobacteriales bacterium]|nr:hypothetical protein [Flavobacteriales bacterium]
MKNKHTDNRFRQVAESYSGNSPEFVWDNIEAQLQPARKKTIFFWLFASISILGIAGFFFFKGAKNQETEVAKSETEWSSYNNQMPIKPTKNTEKTVTTESANIGSFTKSAQLILEPKPLSPEEKPLSSGSLKIESDKPERFIEKEKNEDYPIESLSSADDSKTLMIEEEEAENINDFKKSDEECPVFTKKRKARFFVGLSGLAGLHNTTMTGGELAEVRNSTENEWYTWGVRGKIGIMITNSFYTGVGANFIQQKDKFYYAQEAVTRLIVDIDPVTGEPTNSYTVSGKFVSEGEIKYKTFDLGIFAGYRKAINANLNKPWYIGIEPMLVFNTKLGVNGKTMATNGEISRAENNTNMYKKSLGFGAFLKLSLEKQLTNKLSFMASPYYRTYFKNWNASGYPVSINSSGFGIELGVRKIL